MRAPSLISQPKPDVKKPTVTFNDDDSDSDGFSKKKP
jgi:hypothetical protein